MRSSLLLLVFVLVACKGGSSDTTSTKASNDSTKPQAAPTPEASVAAEPETKAPAPEVTKEEVPDHVWFCACYSEATDTGPHEVTACRFHKDECLDLQRQAEAGSDTIVADSLIMRCKKTYGERPGWRGDEAWEADGPLRWNHPDGCKFGEDFTPIEPLPRPDPSEVEPPPSPDPHPDKLEALAEEYRDADPRDEGNMEMIQARRWHKVNYKKNIIAAAKGDEKALAVILGLELDASGAEIHSANVEVLLLGYGDEAFAKVLATLPKATISMVLSDLDWAIQTTELDDPSHYRQTHPKTFALGPAPESESGEEPSGWWCACSKPEGAAKTTLACFDEVRACAKFEREALTSGGLEKACRYEYGAHPGDQYGSREAWKPAADGSLRSEGQCALGGEPNVPHRPRSNEPRPKVLEALAKLYAAADEDDPLIVQVKDWYDVDYQKLVAKATGGDEGAVGKLVTLDLAGRVSDLHAQDVDSLMRGHGDARFAEILATLPAKDRQRVLRILDEIEPMSMNSREHYRHAYWRTFAAGKHGSE